MLGTSLRHGRAGALAAALQVSLAAGAQPAVAPPAAPALAGVWRIEQARTEPIYDRALARLDFGTEGRLTGHTSCNALKADYRLQGTRLHIGTVTTTRQRCGRQQLEQEDRILTALELAETAQVRPDGLLELRDAEGRGVLRATRPSAGD